MNWQGLTPSSPEYHLKEWSQAISCPLYRFSSLRYDKWIGYIERWKSGGPPWDGEVVLPIIGIRSCKAIARDIALASDLVSRSRPYQVITTGSLGCWRTRAYQWNNLALRVLGSYGQTKSPINLSLTGWYWLSSFWEHRDARTNDRTHKDGL